MSSLTDTASADLHRQAADPGTDLGTLADIATHHPALRATVAANPSTYEGLLDWLGQLGDPAVDAALAIRAGGAPVVAPAVSPYAAAVTPSTDRWTEPTRSLRLAWGDYRSRYLAAVALMVAPAPISLLIGVLYSMSLPHELYWIYGLVQIGPLVSMVLLWGAAVVIIPTTPARRVIAAGILLLSTIVAGALVIPAWLVLRARPGLSYLAVLFTLLTLPLFILTQAYGFMSLVLTAIIVGASWVGRAIAPSRPPVTFLKATPADREAAAHAARVAHIQQWEQAYASAHGGALPPAGFVPPAAAASGATNTMAILALVFGIGGGLGGIIFGHVARGQIRRTGEGGWGLATAGLVLGYIGLASGVIALIVWLILWATLLN